MNNMIISFIETILMTGFSLSQCQMHTEINFDAMQTFGMV